MRLVFEGWTEHGVRDTMVETRIDLASVTIDAEPDRPVVYVYLDDRVGRQLHDRLQDPNATKGRPAPRML